jgi:transporter family-2 protein
VMWALLGLLGGIASAAQTTVNSAMGLRVGILVAALISMTTTMILLALWVLPSLRFGALIEQLQRAPAYLLLGGVFGGAFVVLMIVVAPRIGVGPATLAAVCGQIIASLLIDHFGLLGTTRLPVTGPQIIGGGMLLVGTFIVIHFKNPG